MSTPIPPALSAAATPPNSSGATTALVFGIISLICCGGALSPVAWYLGNKEMKAVDAGHSPVSNRGLAQVAVVLGIIGTIWFALWFVWVLFLGGLATLGALAGAT